MSKLTSPQAYREELKQRIIDPKIRKQSQWQSQLQ